MKLVSELRRRNVFRMAVLYAVAAWLIMQVAEVVIGLANLPEWIGPTILGLLAVGFPIALVFSWFYELTAEGISLEKDVEAAESITHVTGRRIDFLVISLLCAAVILFAYDKWWTGPPPEKSIAVLAFENMSGDPDQEYFSDGISEELLNVLAQLPGLRVAARTSSFQFKGQNEDIAKIAATLNVAHVLEGSVRKSGNKLRITAQLIKADDGFHLWSETYDRKLENIFDVQDEISAAIVGALKERLGLQVEVAPRMTEPASIEAHDAYLRGRYLVVQSTPSTVNGAVREFEKAIAFDPDYALAHAELAIATLLRTVFGDGLSIGETTANADSHAERALALDPTLAEAHAATGFVLFANSLWTNSKFDECLPHLRQAIHINPNYSMVYTWMGSLLGDYLGRYTEAFAAHETALRLDPLSIQGSHQYILGLIERNRLDEADRELEKLASIAPSFYANLRGLRESVGGKWANAILGNLDALQIDTEHPLWRQELILEFAILGLEEEVLAFGTIPDYMEVQVRSRMGKTEDAVAIAEARLVGRPTSPLAQRDLGLALAGAGDYTRARPILEEAWQRSGGLVTNFGMLQDDHVAALIAIRRDAGEEAAVGELIAAINDNVRRSREAGVTAAWPNALYPAVYGADYDEGLAAFLVGERERGLGLIAKALEEGVFILPRQAYLQELYDDSGFAPIRAGQEARQKRERDKFLAIVCADNPYEAVWQPAEGTCERYAAAGRK